MKLKGGISRWSQRFYIGREHMVCTDLNNTSRWWRVSQSLVWKSFSGCLLAFYCFDVGYFYCKFGCILNSWKVRPWFWSSQTLIFADIEQGKRNYFLRKNLTDMHSLTEAICFSYRQNSDQNSRRIPLSSAKFQLE